MDVRFVDAKNRTFFVQRGGDSYVDPTWARDIATSISRDITEAERAEDFAMAQEAAAAFGKIATPDFRAHKFLFTKFAAQPAPMRDPNLLAGLKEMAEKYPAPAVTESEYGRYDRVGWTQVYTKLYAGDTGCAAWICVARHSATIMYVNPNVGYWQIAIVANNHGRGPWDDGMSAQCWSGGGSFNEVHLSGSTAPGATGANDGYGGCQTPYDWNSGDYDHLCNDDAAYELWQGKRGNTGSNSVYGTGGGNITFQYYNGGRYHACNCGSFNGCDNDWSQPSCP
jgi:hypothetical protein